MPSINVIILAAGYGTRLSTQIKNLENSNPEAYQKYKNLLNLPKALLPIKRKPLLTYWIEYLLTLHASNKNDITLEKFIIITNNKYHTQFTSWWSKLCCHEGIANIKTANDLNNAFCKSHARKATTKSIETGEDLPLSDSEIEAYLNKLVSIEILNDNTNFNEERLGCNGSIRYALDKAVPVDSQLPLLVVASDLLFQRPYNLEDFFKNSFSLNENSPSKVSWTSKLTAYKIPSERVHKHGIIEVDENNKVKKFLEKPSLSETDSRSACPCFYLLNYEAIKVLRKFTDQENCPDASGHFLRHLIENEPGCPLLAQFVEGRYDIGSLETFLECDENY